MQTIKPKIILLNHKDLPIYCPNLKTLLWSSHPRVFLKFDNNDIAKCPYCGTMYQLN